MKWAIMLRPQRNGSIYCNEGTSFAKIERIDGSLSASFKKQHHQEQGVRSSEVSLLEGNVQQIVPAEEHASLVEALKLVEIALCLIKFVYHFGPYLYQ